MGSAVATSWGAMKAVQYPWEIAESSHPSQEIYFHSRLRFQV